MAGNASPAPGSIRVVRGHQVRDPHGCTFGILDYNPDIADPAVALGISAADGTPVDRPVCRTGREFRCAVSAWRVVRTQTQGIVLVDLLPLGGDA